MRYFFPWVMVACLIAFLASPSMGNVSASEYVRPWLAGHSAIVVDPYSLNPIDWNKITRDKRIAAFIHKATEGAPPAKSCRDLAGYAKRACIFENKYQYVNIELMRTREFVAKKLGYKWGTYHLGLAGDPIEQAKYYLRIARPQKGDLLALDIEGLEADKWMSLQDAEKFASYVRKQTGQDVLLYVNHKVASKIAENARIYPLLAELPLWYARFKEDIEGVFPLGPYKTYSLWQFKSEINCSKDAKCPYELSGTQYDMDLNVYPESVETLKKRWPNIAR